jgi:hypothetical protein
MDFCECQGIPRYIQLLSARLFLASWKFPATAFTLACVNDLETSAKKKSSQLITSTSFFALRQTALVSRSSMFVIAVVL